MGEYKVWFQTMPLFLLSHVRACKVDFEIFEITSLHSTLKGDGATCFILPGPHPGKIISTTHAGMKLR